MVKNLKLALASLSVLAACSWAGQAPQEAPWKVNRPIVSVTKEVYAKHPRPGVALVVTVGYVGPELEREEVHSFEAVSDTPTELTRRRSPDNGRTWSKFEPLPPVVTFERGVRVNWGGGAYLYDPAAKVTVSFWSRQTGIPPSSSPEDFYMHLFYRISRDNGKSWSEPKQLRYEQGDAFDPKDPFKESFLKYNQAYLATSTIRHSNGTIIHCVTAANVPYVDAQGRTSIRPLGSLCFIGKWNPKAPDYAWTAGERVWVPLEVSSRGLDEAAVAELKDGRVLVIWRGSNSQSHWEKQGGVGPMTTPGRKWFSISKDGGRTLSKVQELKYDDGSSFYSPSSIDRMIRHSLTGKLYWIGNISSVPPQGNSPRYPLVIAEVDESIPALKRSTLTAIDDRQPGEGEGLQLSNFFVLENRETHMLEIYLTRYGADPKDFWGADVYKYTLSFK